MHKIKCFKELPFHDMIVGAVYCYNVQELIVEYWEDGESWPMKQFMPIYAWAAALIQKDIVPVDDLSKDEED